RAVCESARFVPAGQPVRADDFRRGFVPPARIFLLPPGVFWRAVNGGSRTLLAPGLDGQIFRYPNNVKYWRACRSGERTRLVAFPDYQYPMVKLFPYWNLRFAPEGFNEVQALLPTDRFEAGLRALLAVCQRHGRTPEVCAVRRHRADP